MTITGTPSTCDRQTVTVPEKDTGQWTAWNAYMHRFFSNKRIDRDLPKKQCGHPTHFALVFSIFAFQHRYWWLCGNGHGIDDAQQKQQWYVAQNNGKQQQEKQKNVSMSIKIKKARSSRKIKLLSDSQNQLTKEGITKMGHKCDLLLLVWWLLSLPLFEIHSRGRRELETATIHIMCKGKKTKTMTVGRLAVEVFI